MKTNDSKPTSSKTRDMVLIAMFAVLMVICSFAVFLTVSVLGGKRGTITICIYLLLGIIGVPVYAGGTAGIGVILGNTGGYMIGWIFSGLVMWVMEIILGKKTWVLVLSMLVGLIVCYALGTAWFMIIYANEAGKIGLWTAITWCVIPFVIPDLVKIGLALAINKRLRNVINRI